VSKMSSSIRVGIIGAGFWGANHARVISELEGATLTAICDINIERAKSVARRYGAPYIFQNYVDLLRCDEIDAVTICTPSTTHAEICIEALSRGKDVLVEKPMASSLEESMRVVDAAKSSGRRVMVGFIERFNPAVEVAKGPSGEGEDWQANPHIWAEDRSLAGEDRRHRSAEGYFNT